MIDVSKVSANRVDLTVSGAIDADIMRDGLDALIAASEEIENGIMLYTISDFEMPSASAIGVKFGQLPQLFALIRKFDRFAVVSDQGWIRSAAEVEGALIPGLRIKAFEPNQKDEAEAWLATG